MGAPALIPPRPAPPAAPVAVVSPPLHHAVVGAGPLAELAPRVQALFADVFGRRYPAHLWGHYFEEPPGLPAAAVGVWDRDALVGFAALLPLELEGRAAGETLDLGLLATVMIAPAHRHGGSTYVDLLSEVETVARALGHRGLLAFPNAAALPVLTRLGGFATVDVARWVDGPLEAGGHAAFLRRQGGLASFTPRAWRWRLGRFDYRVGSGRVTKTWAGAPNCLAVLDVDRALPWSGVHVRWESAGPCALPQVQPDRVNLCWRPLGDADLIDRVRRCVMLSDVF